MVIRLLDHVSRCSTYEEGDVIFHLVKPALDADQDVTLSFEGVEAVPSAFVNGALVRLAEASSVGKIRQHLKITNSTRQINDLIKSRFAYVEAQQHGCVA